MPLLARRNPKLMKATRERYGTENGITKKYTAQSTFTLDALKQRIEAVKAKHVIAEQLEERKRIGTNMDEALFSTSLPEQHQPISFVSSKERLLALTEPPAFDINAIWAAVDTSLALKRNRPPPPPPLRPNPQAQSSFLAIAVEIRLEIYKLVLITPEPIFDPPRLMEIWREQLQKPSWVCGVSGSLLSTCSKIYQEAILIPYQENTFAFTSAYALQCFRGLDYVVPGCPLRTQMLRKLYLWFGNTDCTTAREKSAETQARDWRMHIFEEAGSILSELDELTLDFSGWSQVPSRFWGKLKKGGMKTRKLSILGLEDDDYVKGEIEQMVIKLE